MERISDEELEELIEGVEYYYANTHPMKRALTELRDRRSREKDDAFKDAVAEWAIGGPGPKCPKCGEHMGKQTSPNDGTWVCGSIKCGYEVNVLDTEAAAAARKEKT